MGIYCRLKASAQTRLYWARIQRLKARCFANFEIHPRSTIAQSIDRQLRCNDIALDLTPQEIVAIAFARTYYAICVEHVIAQGDIRAVMLTEQRERVAVQATTWVAAARNGRKFPRRQSVETRHGIYRRVRASLERQALGAPAPSTRPFEKPL